MNTITPRTAIEALLADLELPAITPNTVTPLTLCLILGDDYLFLHGRKFLTEILQSKTQERINAAEQTREAKQCPHCQKKRKSAKKQQRR